MKLREYLRLMRIPNVFTSFANVVAGVCLARGGEFQTRDLAVVLGSGALYCAGMVWNDYFDRAIDAQERPDRPIPSGAVSPRAAAAVGGGLLALGLALCAWHGLLPLLLAVLLSAAILLYDAWLKNTWAGPLGMGMCRTLNVWLGFSVVPFGVQWLHPLPIVLGYFTLLITQLSRFEVGGTSPERLHGTLRGIVSAGVIFMLTTVLLARTASLPSWIALALLLGYVLMRGRALYTPLTKTVTPPLLGRGIGGGILLMPAIDAAFVAASGAPLAAAAVFSLTAPAWLLKRWYYLT